MENVIIEKAKEICRVGFMDYPDYDESIPMSLGDALTILVFEHFDHDTDVDVNELYEFISNKVEK